MRDRPTQSDPNAIGPRPAGWCKLAIGLLAIGFVWLIALPRIASTPPVERHIERQQRQGIDPSAMFYTELEILPPIAHRYERLRKTQGTQLGNR